MKEKVWSIYWSGNSVIEKVEVTYHKFKFPYTVFKTRQSPYTEFYGIMKDAKGHQDAINRTLAILQEKIGWDKPIIETGRSERHTQISRSVGESSWCCTSRAPK